MEDEQQKYFMNEVVWAKIRGCNYLTNKFLGGLQW